MAEERDPNSWTRRGRATGYKGTWKTPTADATEERGEGQNRLDKAGKEH